MNFIPNTVGR